MHSTVTPLHELAVPVPGTELEISSLTVKATAQSGRDSDLGAHSLQVAANGTAKPPGQTRTQTRLLAGGQRSSED